MRRVGVTAHCRTAAEVPPFDRADAAPARSFVRRRAPPFVGLARPDSRARRPERFGPSVIVRRIGGASFGGVPGLCSALPGNGTGTGPFPGRPRARAPDPRPGAANNHPPPHRVFPADDASLRKIVSMDPCTSSALRFTTRIPGAIFV